MNLTDAQRKKIFEILAGHEISKFESPAKETLEGFASTELRAIEEVLAEIDKLSDKWKNDWGPDSNIGGTFIEGLDCIIFLTPRPIYCDRGNWIAKIDYKPTGNRLRLWLDDADLWPRYYMDLTRAKLECEDWLKKRKQWIAKETKCGITT